jgi:uncharacterized protein YndB with AHSA1/START domain
MGQGFMARASAEIAAPADKVWEALTQPDLIRQYMFGTDVVSDWRVGGSITWKGEWQGRAYEDKGTILRIEKMRLLEYSHFSPLSGAPDAPENYHTVTIELKSEGLRTIVALRQDGNPTEEARAHSEKNWRMMLAGLKALLEKPSFERKA